MHDTLRCWMSSEDSSLFKSNSKASLLTPQNKGQLLGGGGWRSGKQSPTWKMNCHSLPIWGLAPRPPLALHPVPLSASLPLLQPRWAPWRSSNTPSVLHLSTCPAMNGNHTRQSTEGTEHRPSVTKTLAELQSQMGDNEATQRSPMSGSQPVPEARGTEGRGNVKSERTNWKGI